MGRENARTFLFSVYRVPRLLYAVNSPAQSMQLLATYQ